ncbi:tyrosine-type recombinase/integrase [Sedimentitalea sp.]|uniref:tyrosine-type recombinase/integrase n=1 Tax=Sedimentitalea sp. TaxID=2048915 RepID=UPI00329A4313
MTAAIQTPNHRNQNRHQVSKPHVQSRPRDFQTRRIVTWGRGEPSRNTTAATTWLIIKLLVVTGLRITELTNLKIRDISPDEDQILVHSKGRSATFQNDTQRTFSRRGFHFANLCASFVKSTITTALVVCENCRLAAISTP